MPVQGERCIRVEAGARNQDHPIGAGEKSRNPSKLRQKQSIRKIQQGNFLPQYESCSRARKLGGTTVKKYKLEDAFASLNYAGVHRLQPSCPKSHMLSVQQQRRQKRQKDAWMERPSSPASVLSAPQSSMVRQPLPEDVEVSLINNKNDKKKLHTKGYMRETFSSQAKRKPKMERECKSSMERECKSSMAILNSSRTFTSKIPHAPGVPRRTSFDSARVSRRSESEVSMTDTAIDTHLKCVGTASSKCTDEAIKEWLDGHVKSGQFPAREVKEICLTRSLSGNNWAVVNVHVGQKNQSTSPFSGEEEGVESESGLDVVKELEGSESGLDDGEKSSYGFNEFDDGKVPRVPSVGQYPPSITLLSGEEEGEKTAELELSQHPFDIWLDVVEDEEETKSGLGGGEESRNSKNGLNHRKGHPLGIGHLLTFLLGAGTMSVLGALK